MFSLKNYHEFNERKCKLFLWGLSSIFIPALGNYFK